MKRLVSRGLVSAVACVVLLWGCNPTVDEETGDSDVAPPVDVTVPGPYGVGQRVESVTYRPDGLDEDRTLRVVVWYPTTDTAGQASVWGESLVNATVIPDVRFPVLAYTHGTTSFAECAYDLMEHFASHGFVVVSADHTGDTLVNFGAQRETEMFLVRPQDVSAVIDWVYALPEDDPLGGRLTEELALAGHSYGGFNAFAVAGASYAEEEIAACDGSVDSAWCSTMSETYADLFRAGFVDERVKALLPMAPGNSSLFGTSGVEDVTIPVMHMTASLDSSNSNEEDGDPYWAQITSPDAVRVNYDRGGHHSYIFTCEVSPGIGDSNGGGCGPEFTDYRVLLDATNVYALAFARRHLLGDTDMDPILEGTASTFDEVTLSYK